MGISMGDVGRVARQAGNTMNHTYDNDQDDPNQTYQGQPQAPQQAPPSNYPGQYVPKDVIEDYYRRQYQSPLAVLAQLMQVLGYMNPNSPQGVGANAAAQNNVLRTVLSGMGISGADQQFFNMNGTNPNAQFNYGLGAAPQVMDQVRDNNRLRDLYAKTLRNKQYTGPLEGQGKGGMVGGMPENLLDNMGALPTYQQNALLRGYTTPSTNEDVKTKYAGQFNQIITDPQQTPWKNGQRTLQGPVTDPWR